MSTVSTAIPFAEPDMTLGDGDEIGNQICVLVATYANAMLLCPTSFHQEDAVAMCKGLDWEHPKGVLWFTEMEMVLWFWSDSAMITTMHWLTVNMVWHGNPIVLHIWPLNTKQVRDYIAIRSNCPFGTPAQAPDKGMEFQPPPNEPSPDNGLWRMLTRDIQELDNDHRWEAL